MRYIMFMVALMLSLSASAQGIERVRRGLLDGTTGEGRVMVLEGEGVADAVTAVESQRHKKTINGYRVVIFSDNGQYASDNASAVYAGFKSHYPGIGAYLVFESPYFKVSVGNCVTMEEAQMLVSQIQGSYPTAFPRRETIPLSELKTPTRHVVEPVDSLAQPLQITE